MLALAALFYLVFSYSQYLAKASAGETLVFQSNLHFLLLPSAFLVLLFFKSLSSLFFSFGSKYDSHVLIGSLLVMLIGGYAMQEHVLEKIKNSGYVKCEKIKHSGLRSGAYVYEKESSSCKL